MADGKADKKKKFYALKMIAPTQLAIVMAKDQTKVIKANKRAKISIKQGRKTEKVDRPKGKKAIKDKVARQKARGKKTKVIS